MRAQLRLIREQPARYLPLAWRYVMTWPLRWLSRLLVRAPFRLQEQMDIHPSSIWRDARFLEGTGGFFRLQDPVKRRLVTGQPWDGVRRDMLVLLMRSVLDRGIEGDFAEVGVYRGESARLIHQYAPDRRLHLFDTFSGFAAGDVCSDGRVTGAQDVAGHYADTSVAAVLRRVQPQGDGTGVVVHVGHFPENIPVGLERATFAFVHLDVDLLEPIQAGLEWFFPRLSAGGFLVVHDYNAWLGPRRAVDAFAAGRGLVPIPLPDKNGSVLLVKA